MTQIYSASKRPERYLIIANLLMSLLFIFQLFQHVHCTTSIKLVRRLLRLVSCFWLLSEIPKQHILPQQRFVFPFDFPCDFLLIFYIDTPSSCDSCDIQLMDKNGRPEPTDFSFYLPFFLQDNPSEECAKGGHAAYGQVS